MAGPNKYTYFPPPSADNFTATYCRSNKVYYYRYEENRDNENITIKQINLWEWPNCRPIIVPQNFLYPYREVENSVYVTYVSSIEQTVNDVVYPVGTIFNTTYESGGSRRLVPYYYTVSTSTEPDIDKFMSDQLDTKLITYWQSDTLDPNNYSNEFPNVLYGYPGTYIEKSTTYNMIKTNIPIFSNMDAIEKYAKDGDTSGADNADDLDGSGEEKLDFYLTNDGYELVIKAIGNGDKGSFGSANDFEPNKVKYEFHDNTPLVTNEFTVYQSYPFEESLDWDFFDSSWIAGVTIPVKIGDMNIDIYPMKDNTTLAHLQARVKRKTLPGVGDVSVTVLIGLDNGYRLNATTGNEFDNIGMDEDIGGKNDISKNPKYSSNTSGATNDEDEISSFPSNLVATYKVTDGALNDIGRFLWADSLFDDIKLLNNSPLENIISCIKMPCNIGGSNETIQIGNIELVTTGVRVNHTMTKSYKHSFTVPSFYKGSFISYEPYSSFSLYLPLVGLIDLPATDTFGYKLTVEYAFDVVVGSFGVWVYTDKGGGKTLLYSSTGVCSINIPLIASNNAQVQSSLIANLATGVSSAATGSVPGTLYSVGNMITTQHHTTVFGSPSSMIGALNPYNIFYIQKTPIPDIPSNYGHTKGFMCKKNYKISVLRGYTKCANVDVSGIIYRKTGNGPLKEELDEIKSILESGWYYGE